MVEDKEEKEEEVLVWLALHLVVVGDFLVVRVRVSGGLGWLLMDPKVDSCWVFGKATSMFDNDVAIFEWRWWSKIQYGGSHGIDYVNKRYGILFIAKENEIMNQLYCMWGERVM